MVKRAAGKADEADEVERFLEGLEHPLKREIAALRRAILASDPEITEHIKWKAPSFCIDGDDRVTFRLHPPDGIHLVFHRGVRVRDASAFEFTDGTGLMKWAARDRAQVTLRSAEEAKAREQDLVALVNRWMRATR